jgi:hypothetical protein
MTGLRYQPTDMSGESQENLSKSELKAKFAFGECFEQNTRA